VGLAIWVASVENQRRSGQHNATSSLPMTSHDYLPVSTDPQLEDGQRVWAIRNGGMDVELCSIDGSPGPGMITEEDLLDELKVLHSFSF
jgi:hypothetical protein